MILLPFAVNVILCPSISSVAVSNKHLMGKTTTKQQKNNFNF